MTGEPKLDVYQRVTNQIIAAIEAGTGEYRMPWNLRLCGGASVRTPQNPIGRYGYRGVNVLSLWASQQANAHPTAEWASYRQWSSIGAQVRAGEKGTMTVFFKSMDTGQDQDADQGRPRRGAFVARTATLFNAAQVDNYQPHTPPPLPEIKRHAAADHLISTSGAVIHHGGHRACYIPSRDENPANFSASESN
jgi:antirestriction protein ArdC